MSDSYYYYHSSPLREAPPGPQPAPQVVSALQHPAGVGASTCRPAGRDQPTHQAEPAGLILPGGKVFPAGPQARPGHQPLADPPTSLAYLDFGEGLGSPLGGRLVPPGQRGAEPLDLTASLSELGSWEQVTADPVLKGTGLVADWSWAGTDRHGWGVDAGGMRAGLMTLRNVEGARTDPTSQGRCPGWWEMVVVKLLAGS